MTRFPFPDGLGAQPFAVRKAREQGVAPALLRRHNLTIPTRGVRRLANPSVIPTNLRQLGATEQLMAVREDAKAFHLVFPEQVAYSHLTALQLFDIPLPPALNRVNTLHAMTRTSHGQIKRPGVVGHRGLQRRAMETVHGLPVVSRTHTWCDIGEFVTSHRLSVDDLVALGDMILRSIAAPESDDEARERAVEQILRPGTNLRRVREQEKAAAAIAEMQDILLSRARPRGKRALLQALPLLRAGVKSPQESRARMLFHRAGFPEPEVNVDIFAEHGAGWLAEGDLVWREQKVVAEYQGAHHAGRRQRSMDRAKAESLSDDGWTVVEIWHEDLWQQPRRVALLRRTSRALTLDPRRLSIA